jgi:hypothetical protein
MKKLLDDPIDRKHALTLGAGLAVTLAGVGAFTTAAHAEGMPAGPRRDAGAGDTDGDTDGDAIARALGKKGQMMPGGVYRVGLPRTDLRVTVRGVPVKAGFALGSYAAFKGMGGTTMVMGDLALLDSEVDAVMARLLQHGLTITGLHNHLNEMSPHVLYLHYTGQGDAARLAAALRVGIAASGTPLGVAPPPSTAPLSIDTARIAAILGHAGKATGGVFSVSVARAETIREQGMELLPAMGVTTAFNFQPTGPGRAAITGDFALVAAEVNPVMRALRANGIAVHAIHNHALADDPRLFYMHFFAADDAIHLAHGLRAALDKTNHS